MRRPYGLRPRILASLVFTAVVTLAIAAIALLGPLQDRLKQESARQLQAAVLAARPGIEQDFRQGFFENIYTLSLRTDALVLVYDTLPK